MRCPLLLAAVAALAATWLAAGQERSIQWRWDVRQAVERARATARPLLIVVHDRSARRSDVDRAQRRTLRNPAVSALVHERFIPVRLAQSDENRRLLTELGVTVAYGNVMVVATPDGEQVGTIAPAATTTVPALLEQLTALFRRYRQDLFERVLKPRLEQDPLDLRTARPAIDRIRAFHIVSADETLVHLLERDELPGGLRQEIYRTLAVLSTETAVEGLVTRADQDDRAARQALRSATPAGALHMLEWLRTDEGDVRPHVYEAMVRICDIGEARDLWFWENASDQRQQDEIERVERIVQREARRWQERIGQYR